GVGDRLTALPRALDGDALVVNLPPLDDAALDDRLSSAMSDVAEVEQANARFYQAFETLDLARMELVWARGEHVKCVHPGWPILIGWDAVRSSWESIFQNTAERRFTLSDVRASACGDRALVTFTENIFSEVHGRLGVTSVL